MSRIAGHERSRDLAKPFVCFWLELSGPTRSSAEIAGVAEETGV